MGICKVKECANLDKCNKHCIYNSGNALVQFLVGISVVETSIGEIRDVQLHGGEPRIISGIQIEDEGTPSNILAPLTVSLDLSSKFLQPFGKNTMQVLNEYLSKYPGVYTPSNVLEIKDRFKKLQSNKIVITPIKPKMRCEIRELIDNKTKVYETTVEFIKCGNNIQTGKFESHIITYATGSEDQVKRHKVNIEDYGDNIRLTQIERTIKNNKVDRKCVKMTRYGYIKPVIITDGSVTLAVDGTYLYRMLPDTVTLIGYWENGKMVESESTADIQKSDAYTYLQNNLDYIEKHRRFIVPYGFIEQTNINI